MISVWTSWWSLYHFSSVFLFFFFFFCSVLREVASTFCSAFSIEFSHFLLSCFNFLFSELHAFLFHAYNIISYYSKNVNGRVFGFVFFSLSGFHFPQVKFPVSLFFYLPHYSLSFNAGCSLVICSSVWISKHVGGACWVYGYRLGRFPRDTLFSSLTGKDLVLIPPKEYTQAFSHAVRPPVQGPSSKWPSILLSGGRWNKAVAKLCGVEEGI